MPPTLSKAAQQKAILFAIVAFLIMFVLIQFITRPAIRTLRDLTQQVSQLRENLKKSEVLIANKSKMKDQLVSLQARLEDFKSALPLRSDMPNILQDISRLASESKVKILKIEPVKSEKLPQAAPQTKQVAVQTPPTIYTETPIKIEARGGYHSVGEFINRIENAKNFMSIADLEIESDSAGMYSHNVRLLIIAYVLQEELPNK